MRVAGWIVDTLVQHGMEKVFMVAGGGAMYLNNAVGAQPSLDVMCILHEQAAAIARTIWFVRLTLSLKVLILASLALVGLRRWKKGVPAIIRQRCSRYTFMAISIAFRRADALSVSASVILS